MTDSTGSTPAPPASNKKTVKLGRKPLYSKAMTVAERKAKQRRAQDARILDIDYNLWTESDCMRALSTKKFKALHKLAWIQLGVLKGYR